MVDVGLFVGTVCIIHSYGKEIAAYVENFVPTEEAILKMS